LLSSVSDIDLWQATAQGDREAFGILFRRHYALLYQYGSRICSDSATLEDCIQELFVELWQKKSTQPVQSVKAYLMQALKFKLYKSFRNNKPTQDVEEINHEPFVMGHDDFLIHGQENEEKTKQIIEALDKLPSRQKEVIYLKIYKGLSYEEVSQVMEINYQVVRNLLCQALKTFRKLIAPVILAVAVFIS
jgi:RNA polymerase sigma factor (sigma-70 family)